MLAARFLLFPELHYFENRDLAPLSLHKMSIAVTPTTVLFATDTRLLYQSRSVRSHVMVVGLVDSFSRYGSRAGRFVLML